MSMPQYIPTVNPEELLEEELDSLQGYAIVIYNDDVNTFEHVICCLVELCDHLPEQAEQCAWIIHSKGKYAVKNGDYETLAPICDALCLRGLSAVIEEA